MLDRTVYTSSLPSAPSDLNPLDDELRKCFIMATEKLRLFIIFVSFSVGLYHDT